MKTLLAMASAVILFSTTSVAQAGDFSFSITVGGPPVVITQAPDFLYPPELGYGVAVGVPYDMFYISGIYYIFRGGGWYRTTNYGGSWIKMRYRELPPQLRRYKVARIHEFRDREYRAYAQDREHYRGRAFRPGREERREMGGRGREERHDVREQRHENRRDMQEQRQDDRRDMREQRQEDRRDGREQRREDRHGGQ